MKKHHQVEAVEFLPEKLKMRIDGEEYEFKLAAISKKLLRASELERKEYEISPSEYGIHWPLIDEDLSIDGLLGVKHAPRDIHQSMQT